MHWKTAGRLGVVSIFFATLFVVNSNEIFGGVFGPSSPTDTDAETPVSVGVGYFHYQGEWDPRDDWKDEGTVMGSDVADVRQNRFYLQTSFRFTEDWEGFMRVGGADINARNAMYDGVDLSDSSQFYTSLGVKGLTYEMPEHYHARIGFGTFLNASWYSGYKNTEDAEVEGDAGEQTLEYQDPWEINFGMAAQVKITELNDLLFYGGPFFYYSTARARISFEGEQKSLSDNVKIEEKGNFGVFAGIRLPIEEGVNVNIESQYKSDFSVGASLSYSF